MVSRQNAALSSTTQRAMHPELGGKWETEYLNTTLPLPTLLLCAGYIVKLMYLYSWYLLAKASRRECMKTFGFCFLFFMHIALVGRRNLMLRRSVLLRHFYLRPITYATGYGFDSFRLRFLQSHGTLY